MSNENLPAADEIPAFDDLTVEELEEFGGMGTASTIGTVSTPATLGTAACIG